MYPGDGREILRKVKIMQYQQAELRLRLFLVLRVVLLGRQNIHRLFEGGAAENGASSSVRRKSGAIAKYVPGWKG